MASERASCAGRRGPALFPPSPEMPWAKRQGWDRSCQQERRRAAGEGAPAPALPQRSASRTKTRAPGQRGKAASQGSGSRLTAGHLRPVAEPSPFGARSKADWARLGHRGLCVVHGFPPFLPRCMSESAAAPEPQLPP